MTRISVFENIHEREVVFSYCCIRKELLSLPWSSSIRCQFRFEPVVHSNRAFRRRPSRYSAGFT